MVDIQLEKKEQHGLISQDWTIKNSDLQLISDSNELAQNLKIRLQFIHGEWFLDITAGTAYFEKIFHKNLDIAEVNREFKRVILSTEGVTDLVAFDADYNTKKRTYTVTFRVNTIYGELTVDDLHIGV